MEEQPALRISWSQLSTFEHCKQKAFLYREGKRSPTTNIRAFFPGTTVDRTMRAFLDLEKPEKGFMAHEVRNIMDAEEQLALSTGDGVVRWKHKDDKEETIKWCTTLVNKLEPILMELVVPYEYDTALRFKTEVSIPGPEGKPIKIQLVGEMDLLVRDDAPNVSIWDLKATENNAYWRKTWGQLLFYDIAVQAMFGGSVKANRAGLIQPMCNDPVIQFSFTDDDRAQMWSRITRYAEARWREDYAPKDDSSGCSICDVRHACAKFTVNNVNSTRITSLQSPRSNNG